MEEKTMEQRYKSAKNCGRLMALVERAKNVSSGSWNDGVMMNSYGEALCKKPADYVAKLQKHFWIYQAKLNTGKFIERMNELCQGIDIPELSNSFSTKEAACFYFGYIEEMNYWKEKKKDAKSEDAKSGTDEQKSS